MTPPVGHRSADLPLAHGVGESADLPLPLDLVLQAGAATLVLSFLIAGLWWREPRLEPSVPRSLGLGGYLRYPVLLLALYVTGYAVAGPRGPENPAPHALFVLLWVGLVPVSMIVGPVWRTVNPLRTLFTLLGLPRRGLRPLPPGTSGSAWPAAAFLLAFVWFELVVPHHGDPVAVGLFLLAYAVSQLLLATLRGEEWFARGDSFEVYSDLAGRLSPFRWRPLLSGLAGPAAGESTSTAPANPVPTSVAPANPVPMPGAAEAPAPSAAAGVAVSTRARQSLATAGLAAFIAVWWGSTVFDSASSSPAWTTLTRNPLSGTAGLVLLCSSVFLAVRWTAGRLDVTMSLIPIAAGYTLAHYLSLLITEGPRGLLLLAGSDITGTITPSPQLISAVQIALILIGHAVGVIVAHDRALAEHPGRPLLAVLADEFPMVLFMIGCTWAGLFLLFVR
ncbi:hypothetical protein FHR83_005585 [Actinoplanes campanulatus]|uniref:Uncharacterized protein n=1 Tax=Actinoplanes campanulatus TaxID=113559 RepID=A0A7W5FGU3_9ACTN|nr:hypothetical protein [Actinoplanes campanulatus]MBB3097901.1 hypothetical protein [Actinoplanes campanulatus]GGN22603.1 hypothetical protein GCM10010109_37300 [Actinoplanes campanulatus]GID34590.1 hypothetical protein Aca09nite_10960 [Actinoplanes campanulatus]